jgi:thioredoxin reductase (NADPH)
MSTGPSPTTGSSTGTAGPTADLDDPTAFPTLDADEMATLDGLGVRRAVRAGELLYRSGDESYDFHVVVSGAVEIVLDDDGAGGERLITRHVAGRFLGELNLLSGLRVFLTARVVEDGEVIVVPVAEVRRLVAANSRLGQTILTALMARRAVLLAGASPAIRLVGSRYLPATRDLREYLSRSRIPHEWLDPDRDEAVAQLLDSLDITPAALPIVLAPGAVLRSATPGVVADYLGLTVNRLPERCFDLVIVGGGPAGLAAAVYGASEGLRTLGVETLGVGGQAGASSRIENYLGFPTGISGGDLTQKAVVQAERFGAHLSAPCEAMSLREQAGHLVVVLGDGTEVAGRAMIVATGARYRRLPLDRLDEFEGNGVYYAATDLEARACAADPVVVVGGGNSAGQAAMFLAERGSEVTVVVRRPDLGASMSRYLVDRIEDHPRIRVRTEATIGRLDGGKALTGVGIAGRSGDEDVPCAGLFSFIGAEPASAWLSGQAALDDHGFVLTDRALDPTALGDRWHQLARSPLPFETSLPGLFAAGDVRSGSTKRVAAAVGEGSAAVRSIHEYLAFTH